MSVDLFSDGVRCSTEAVFWILTEGVLRHPTFGVVVLRGKKQGRTMAAAGQYDDADSFLAQATKAVRVDLHIAMENNAFQGSGWDCAAALAVFGENQGAVLDLAGKISAVDI